jgi:hypothetical protein
MSDFNKISTKILSQISVLYSGATNPIEVFRNESPITPSREDLEFIRNNASEILSILNILIGIVMYCSNIAISLNNGGVLLISFENDILTFEKHIRNKIFICKSSFEAASFFTKRNMEALIRRGFPERSNDVIVLNTQTQ